MSYFSSKSTWLSLVDSVQTSRSEAEKSDAQPLDGLTLSFEDFRPCFPADGAGIGASRTGDATDASAGKAKIGETADPQDTAEDLDYLRITMELRHRLFFHFKEWEFGPALLEDQLRLAQAQTDPEEALVHYCQARHVAVTLVDKHDQPGYRLAWIEADRVIAEIHDLIGNIESREMYAKEGLQAIKQGKFTADYDMRITKLAVRFLKLLEPPKPA
ncbi:MAG: hypothetical protein ABIW76_01080 [Fibrobacteria bacterium]